MEQLFLFLNANDLDAYGFHANFLSSEQSVLLMWIIAIIVGVAGSAIFYFGCCNSKTTKAHANIQTWIASMVVSAVLTFCIADFAFIGLPGSESVHSFYQCNENFLDKNFDDTNPDYENAVAEKNEIADELDAYGGIRLQFDFLAVVWTLLAGYGCSFLFKKKTINGTHLPHH